MATPKKRAAKAARKKVTRAKPARRAPARKALAKKALAGKPAAKRIPARKPVAKKPAAKKAPARKQPARKAPPPASAALAKALRGHVFDILLDGDCAGSAHAKGVAAALASFRAHLPAALLDAEGHVFLYYLDCKGYFAPGEPGHVEIASPKDVWSHVQFGPEATVGRRDEDGKIYVSLECNCDWEQEHGLQIVLEEGRRVNKVGPFDGHVTNADAYADPTLGNVVYRAH